MKFRLGLSPSGGQSAASGLGSAVQAFAMAPLLERQGLEEAQLQHAKQSLLGAQTAEAQAKADQATEQMRAMSFPEVLKNAALSSGVLPHQLGDFSSYLATGQRPGQYDRPADGVGPVLPAPSYLDPALAQRVTQPAGLIKLGGGLGDKSLKNIAEAGGEWQKQADLRATIANPGQAGVVGQGYAAVAGKPLIDAVGNTGRGFNQFTGAAADIAPGVAALYDRKTLADIVQSNAAAGASAASAANSYASAGLHRAQTEELRNGPKGQFDSERGVLVDPRTGMARPVMMNGQAIGEKNKPLNDTQAKANLFGGRMAEADKVLRDMEGQGVLRPGGIKTTSETVAGFVPFIGDKLGDAAGSAMNWTQGTKQQQVEQAQRDFINAVLRRESGAAIAASEFSSAQRQYFPQPGDSKAVIEQKRRNRQIATTLMLQEVPQAQRYQLGQVPMAPAAAPAAMPTGGATGSWDNAPAPAAGWSIRRVN